MMINRALVARITLRVGFKFVSDWTGLTGKSDIMTLEAFAWLINMVQVDYRFTSTCF